MKFCALCLFLLYTIYYTRMYITKDGSRKVQFKEAASQTTEVHNIIYS